MIRRGFGCGLALVLAAVLLVAAVAAAPFISAQAPKAISAVKSGIARLEADVEGKPTPSIARLWPSGPTATPQPTQQPTPTPWTWPTPWPGGTAWAEPSPATCQWGVAILAQDAQFDLQGAVTYPTLAAWYHQSAGWWEVAQNDLTGLCGQGPEPTSAECLADMAHFQTAIATHEAAPTNTIIPDNTAFDQQWNATWIANYARLEAIWTGTGCGQRAGN